MDISGKKIIIHNLTFRGIEVVPGVLDFDQRGLVYADNGDICVTKAPIEADYLSYLENLGWKFDKCRFLNPANQPNYSYNSVFHDKKIISILKSLKGYYLDTYNATKEEGNFSKKAGVPIYANGKLSEKFGTKSGFRKLAKKLGLNIAAGFEEIQTPAELEKAINKLFKLGKKEVVVKIDEGISGAGATKVTLKNWKNKNRREKENFLEKSLFKIKQAQKNSGAVAEEWLENVVASPSVQVQVFPNKNWGVVSLHDQLLEGEEKWYVGCQFPQATLRGGLLKKALKGVKIFTEYLISKNFSGFFGLDLIITKDKQIYWVEANMRKPGTFYPRIIAEKLNNGSLKGISYIATDFSISSFTGLPFSELKEKFQELLYPINSKKEGVVLYNVGALKDSGRFDAVCIGKTNKTAKVIYLDLKKQIRAYKR